MKEGPYFPHDANARHDPKMVALRRKYKSAGYGNYWVLVEMLRESGVLKILMDDMFYESAGSEMDLSADEVRQFIQDLVNYYKLMSVTDQNELFCESLNRRMKEIQDRRDKYSRSGVASALNRHTPKETQLSIEDCPGLLRDDKALQASCEKNLKISPTQYREQLETFIQAETDKGTMSRPYKDVRTHFYNKLQKNSADARFQQATETVQSFRAKYPGRG